MLRQRQKLLSKACHIEEQQAQMSMIHCKIQEEAEKLRKWQTSSEIELKQKITKLRECESVISDQRSQILEMQVENETLATSLQKEQQNQVQINLKLKTTRDLFLALKNHYENLQSSIVRGEKDRDSLRMLEAENIRQIKDMNNKMQEMIETNDKNVSKLRSSLKDKETALEDVKYQCEQEISNAKETNQRLENDITSCKETIDDLSKKLIEKKSDMLTLEEKIACLEEALKKSAFLVTQKESEMLELELSMKAEKDRYDVLSNELNLLQSEHSTLQKEAEKIKADADTQIDELQSELSELTDSLTDLSTRYNELISKHDRLQSENESLKESVSQLVKCVEELQEKQERNEAEMEELTQMNRTAKVREAELTKFIEEKELAFDRMTTMKNEAVDQYKEVSEKFEKLKLKENYYIKEIDELSEASARQNEEFVELGKRLNEVSTGKEDQVQALLKDLEERREAYASLEDKYDTMRVDNENLQSTVVLNKETMVNLMTEKDELKTIMSSYLEKIKGFENEHLKLTTNIEEIKSNFVKFCTEIETSKACLEQQKNIIRCQDTELEKLSNELNTSNSDLILAQSYKSDLQKSLNEVTEKYNELKIQFKTKCDAYTELHSTFKEAKFMSDRNEKTELDRLTDNLKEIRIEKDDLEKRNEKLTKMVSEKNADISAVAEELSKMQNRLRQAEQNGIDKKRFEELEQEVRALGHDKMTAERKNIDLQCIIDSLSSEKQSIITDNESFVQKIKNLENQNIKNQGAMTDMQNKNEKLQERLSKLLVDSAQLEETKKMLSSKEDELEMLKKSLETIKTKFELSEKEKTKTIEHLKQEISSMNKEKIRNVLHNATKSTSPVLPSSPKSPKPSSRNTQSPKTPHTASSRKRRIAFGKSPSWKITNLSDGESDTEQPAKVRHVPKNSIRTYSPSKLKLSSKSPKKSVSQLLKTYPKPPKTQKRGVKLPDSYAKRKEEKAERKSKLKVESCSWFDNDNVFGFDEK